MICILNQGSLLMKIKALLFVGALTLLLSLNIFSYPRDEGALNKPSVSFANLKDGRKKSSST